jgi:hypothetical protein
MAPSDMCSTGLRVIGIGVVRCVVVDINTVHDGRGVVSSEGVAEVVVLHVAVGFSARHGHEEVRGIERVGIRAVVL